MPVAASGAFLNAANGRLWITDGATTPALTLIPTTGIEETPIMAEDTWYDTTNISGGVAHEDGAVGGVGLHLAVTTKAINAGGTSPSLNAKLAVIAGCKDLPEATRRYEFVYAAPNGTASIATFAICDVATIKGQTENAGALTFTLKRRGAATAYTTALPA
jgi:hypothetical protein